MDEQPKAIPTPQVPPANKVRAIKARSTETLVQVDLLEYLLLRKQYLDTGKRLQQKYDHILEALELGASIEPGAHTAYIRHYGGRGNRTARRLIVR